MNQTMSHYEISLAKIIKNSRITLEKIKKQQLVLGGHLKIRNYVKIPQYIFNVGKFPGAKKIMTDSTNFACFIGNDNQVSCSYLERDTDLNLVKPQNLGPVRQIVGERNRLCALTMDGKVKCFTRDNMVAQEVTGF